MPATARRVRALPTTWLALSTVLAPLAVIGTSPDYASWEGLPRQVAEAVYVIALPLSSAAFVALLTAPVWAVLRFRRRGLTGGESLRLVLTEPTARPGFWGRPHIMAILAPAAPPETGRRSECQHDQLQSILRHGGELSGPLRPLGAAAAVAARQVIVSIEQADREIAELARSVEPGEEQRLVGKVEALAPVPGRDDENAPMRQLLEKQLELIRGLSGRIEEAREARNRRVEMLKTLNLHLASLRARSAETPTEVRSLSERVRTLYDDIGRQAVAFRDGTAVGESGTDDTATRERPNQTRPG